MISLNMPKMLRPQMQLKHFQYASLKLFREPFGYTKHVQLCPGKVVKNNEIRQPAKLPLRPPALSIAE